jgi:hypothetical protein
MRATSGRRETGCPAWIAAMQWTTTRQVSVLCAWRYAGQQATWDTHYVIAQYGQDGGTVTGAGATVSGTQMRVDQVLVAVRIATVQHTCGSCCR